jgi:hypothetical protein
MTVHDFTRSLALSASYADAPWWGEVYRQFFPGLQAMVNVRDDGPQQRAGIDRVLTLSTGRVVRVDEKVRAEDWPDFCLEVWSDIEHTRPGWIAKDRECDFIAYAFVPSRRCYLLPFLTLRTAWHRHGAEWRDRAKLKAPGYRVIRADNGRYTTVSIGVPIEDLLAALTGAQIATWQIAA